MDEIGTVVVADDRIQDIGANVDAADDAETVDCSGRILCPGFVDMRSHASDIAAAAAGGVTSFALQPDQKTILDTDASIERIRRRSIEAASVHVYPMGAATKRLEGNEIAEIGQMQASGAVAFTDCRHAIGNAQVMRRLFEYSRYFNALVVQFPQNAELAADGFAHEGEIATRLGLNGIPAIAEVIQIERDLRLAEMAGARVHFSLVSSAAAVSVLRDAKAKGINVTCSVGAHYLHLNDNGLEGYRTFAKVSPPFREETDRLALIEGVADGTIDTIVSDHDPRSQDVKRLPLAQAAIGIVGFETMLPLITALVQDKKITPMRAVDALSTTPARILGLDAGHLSKGAIADIVIFDPDKPWRIDPATLKSSAKNTPFERMPVQGKVWKTIVGGKPVFET